MCGRPWYFFAPRQDPIRVPNIFTMIPFFHGTQILLSSITESVTSGHSYSPTLRSSIVNSPKTSMSVAFHCDPSFAWSFFFHGLFSCDHCFVRDGRYAYISSLYVSLHIFHSGRWWVFSLKKKRVISYFDTFYTLSFLLYSLSVGGLVAFSIVP